MKVYIEDFNGVLTYLVRHFQETGQLTHTWVDADVVILWQDVMGYMADLAQQAKAQGKRVITVEHGLLSVNDYIPPLSRPLSSDLYLTWGQYSKDFMVNRGGIDPNRVKVVGTFLKYQKPIKVKGKERVLFAPRHWLGELNENLAIAETLSTLPYTVRSKIVIGEHDPEKYPNPIMSARQGDDHVSTCFNAIANSDVVVGLGEGTFAALCYMVDVPYISVDLWEPKVLLGKLYTKKEWDSQISDACYKVKLEDLNKTIKNVLKKDTMKKQRQEFRTHALNWGKDPLREFLRVING